MSPGRYSRSLLSLVAAYAIALQSLLLVVAAPGGGSGFAAPICAHSGNGTAPAGHGCDCTANCLAGCCSTPMPPRATATSLAPRLTHKVVGALEDAPLFRLRVNGAYRSRAPPS